MKHRIPIPIIVVTLLLITGCGGSGSGGGNDGPTISPNPGGTASGLLNVPPGNDLELEPNDSLLQAQAVTTSTSVAGRASDPDSGFQLPSGNRVQDLYRLTATEQVRIVLTIAEDNHTANDLDLFLLDSGGAVLQVSEARNTGIELLETPPAGTFLVGVRAFAGASSYTVAFRTLSSLPSDAGVEFFPPGVEIIPSEVVVKRKAKPSTKALNPSAFASKHGLTLSAVNSADIELMTLDPSEASVEDPQQKSAGVAGAKLKKKKAIRPANETRCDPAPTMQFADFASTLM